jgi:putative chitinase
MVMIDASLLLSIAPVRQHAKAVAQRKAILQVAAILPALLKQYGIDTDLRQAHFLAQVWHESSGFTSIQENLNYSTPRAKKVFGKRMAGLDDASKQMFGADATLSPLQRKMLIADVAYANRMGNGDAMSGDGYRYRGRGYVQLTGKKNYTTMGTALNADLAGHPDLVLDPKIALQTACLYWQAHHLNRYADRDDIRHVTLIINGGLNGLVERKALLTKIKYAIKVREDKKPQ